MRLDGLGQDSAPIPKPKLRRWGKIRLHQPLLTANDLVRPRSWLCTPGFKVPICASANTRASVSLPVNNSYLLLPPAASPRCFLSSNLGPVRRLTFAWNFDWAFISGYILFCCWKSTSRNDPKFPAWWKCSSLSSRRSRDTWWSGVAWSQV